MVLTLVQILAYQQTSHYQCPANSAWTRTKPLNYFAVSHSLSVLLFKKVFRSDMMTDIKHKVTDIEQYVSSAVYKHSSPVSYTHLTLPTKLSV